MMITAKLFYEAVIAIRRVRKIAKSELASSCPSVNLSVHMEQLGSQWTDLD
jgi:hypothetical protein